MTVAPQIAPRSIRSRVLGRSRDHAKQERAVLILHDVTKEYPNGKVALRDVDLVIPEGDFVFLVGPSGAGKSTLIKLLIRDEVATRGAVVLDGQDVARLGRRQVPKMRRKIGIIFQDFKLLPSKTVWENVAFALEVTGTPRRKIRPAVDRVLALVGLSAQAQQVPSQLSGGEQQRTAIARALVHDP
ncbi:MAG: cell division ATP-binding protein FtsE, partial [Chloroflexota bacterium]